MIGELKLVYNKTRQAAITKERLKSSPVQPRLSSTEQNWERKWLKRKARLFNVSAPWWTWSSARPDAQVYDALKMDGSALTLEVQQQLGDGVVRTIALGSSDGLRRGMP